MMRLLLLTVAVPVLSINTLAAADLTGAWTIEWRPNFSGQVQAHECTFTQDGRTLTIDCDGAHMKGEVNGRKVKFQHQTGRKDEITVVYEGDLDANGTTMTGTWHLSAPENRKGKFEGRKHQPK
jgi:type 1 fimbria pilin